MTKMIFRSVVMAQAKCAKLNARRRVHKYVVRQTDDGSFGVYLPEGQGRLRDVAGKKCVHDRWTDDEENDLAELLEEGQSYSEIARIMGRSYDSIAQKVHRARQNKGR